MPSFSHNSTVFIRWHTGAAFGICVSLLGLWLCMPAAWSQDATPPVTTGPALAAPAPLTLREVTILGGPFRVAAEERIPIRFELSRPATVTLTIHGPNRELIARVADGVPQQAGVCILEWDGRDVDGVNVPDEAYSVHLQAVAGEETAIWAPWLHSGGERLNAGEVRPLSATELGYTLPRPARVLVRAAVLNGPLLKTIVNWEPRPAGLNIEPWDGYDEQRVRVVTGLAQLRVGVIAFALPDAAILTVGNTTERYGAYYTRVAATRPRHPEVTRVRDAATVLSPHAAIPPHLNRDPGLTLEFLGQETPSTTAPATTQPAEPGAPLKLRGDTILFRVDVPDPAERSFLNDQRFELIIYVNDRRLLEVEQGHVPFTYPWDVAALAPGRHVLTVNLATFRNHVGTVSRVVEIER
ncbi:MAG: hypothetical protein IPM18_05840 [Phycisphaerales bacterium]|nr:hypothetical protein [Phycisphaerales bacterium]